MPRAAHTCTTCHTIIPAGTYRCTTCARTADHARGTRQQRGYDATHDALRKAWAPRVAAGYVCCAKCGLHIQPSTPWDLGHTDDRTDWTGPEHATCNRAHRPSLTI